MIIYLTAAGNTEPGTWNHDYISNYSWEPGTMIIYLTAAGNTEPAEKREENCLLG